jgi:chemotaxis signal transduction protein
MLQDSLPAGASASGLLVDATGKVLASTDARIAVGDSPAFMAGLKAPGASAPTGATLDADAPLPLCHWEGRTYLAGIALSKGYREFKVSDGYRNDVRSVLLVPVDAAAQTQQGFALPKAQLSAGANILQFGVVQCGRMLFALSSTHVIEAVATTHMGAPTADSDCAGLLRYAQGGQVAVLPVYDGCTLTGQSAITDTTNAVAIVLRGGQHTMALLVDRLVDVIECGALEVPPGGINADSPWIGGFIHDNQAHTEPVFALDPRGFGVAAF